MGRVVGWVGIVVGGALAGSSMVGVAAAAAGATPSLQVRAEQGVTVPDVRCSSLSEARQVLRWAGLVGRKLTGGYGVVLSQNPTPRQMVTTGSTVYVVMQPRGHPRVPVPDVRGRNLRTATRVLAGRCLDVAVTDRVRHGRVASQSPSPATLTRVGTQVRLVATAAPPTSGGRRGAEHDGASRGADATPATSGSGSVGSVAVTLLVLLVLAMAIAAVLAWRRVVRPRRRIDWVPSHETALAGAPGGNSAPPVVTKVVTEPRDKNHDQDHRFTWLPKRGTTSATIDEEGS